MACRAVTRGLALASVALVATVVVLDSVGVVHVPELHADSATEALQAAPEDSTELDGGNKEVFHHGMQGLQDDLSKGLFNYRDHIGQGTHKAKGGAHTVLGAFKRILRGFATLISRIFSGFFRLVKSSVHALIGFTRFLFFGFCEIMYWLAYNFIIRPVDFIIRCVLFEGDLKEPTFRKSCAQFLFFVAQVAFAFFYYKKVVRWYPFWMGPSPKSSYFQRITPMQATIQSSPSNIFLSFCCWQAREAHTLEKTWMLPYWQGVAAMFCCPICTLVWANACTDMNLKLGAYWRSAVQNILYSIFCPCCTVAQDAESLDATTGVRTRPNTVEYPMDYAGPLPMPDGVGKGNYAYGFGSCGNGYPVAFETQPLNPMVSSFGPTIMNPMVSTAKPMVPYGPPFATQPMGSGRHW